MDGGPGSCTYPPREGPQFHLLQKDQGAAPPPENRGKRLSLAHSGGGGGEPPMGYARGANCDDSALSRGNGDRWKGLRDQGGEQRWIHCNLERTVWNLGPCSSAQHSLGGVGPNSWPQNIFQSRKRGEKHIFHLPWNTVLIVDLVEGKRLLFKLSFP